ncbi:hypothetical protein EJ04DRAFT_599777, partial [Polyplosphaeria fusca]
YCEQVAVRRGRARSDGGAPIGTRWPCSDALQGWDAASGCTPRAPRAWGRCAPSSTQLPLRCAASAPRRPPAPLGREMKGAQVIWVKHLRIQRRGAPPDTGCWTWTLDLDAGPSRAALLLAMGDSVRSRCAGGPSRRRRPLAVAIVARLEALADGRWNNILPQASQRPQRACRGR